MPRPHRPFLLAMASAIAILYALPLIEGFWRYHALIHVFYPDEAYYAARVLDAARGGTLGNPYLAGHEGAPRYLPEATERTLALLSRAMHLDPLTLLAACRVVLPLLLFLALALLARALGIEERLAILAAAAVPLFPPILTLIQPPGTGEHGFLRLFRSTSPVAHMLLLVLALIALAEVWRRPSIRAVCVGGLLTGILFYTPIYYWSFAIGGTLLLAIFDGKESRKALLGVAGIALLLGVPQLIHSHRLMSVPEVVETLARWRLMVPGRWPEMDVPRRFLENLVVLGVLWLARRRVGQNGRFVFAFCLAGELLLVQNVVTNRQIQAFHFMHCLFLMWPLAAALAWQESGVSSRASSEGSGRGPFERADHGDPDDDDPKAPSQIPRSTLGMTPRGFILASLTALLLASATLVQLIAFENWATWRNDSPQLYTLDLVMPRTLGWLNRHTPPGAVVMAPEDVMASLPLFTHNKVYWTRYAGQHVLSDREVEIRSTDTAHWFENPPQPLHYPADFAVLTGRRCAALSGIVYRDQAEGTCVTKRPFPSPGGRGARGEGLEVAQALGLMVPRAGVCPAVN
jgi:hypothetical protein